MTDLKILIVEDDKGSALLISLFIKIIARDVLKVCSGTEAVNICRKQHDIDLIIMDINMFGMDGYEATRQIRQFNKRTVIIAQTSNTLPGEKEKALDAGCNDYISKPIQKEVLLEIIDAQINDNIRNERNKTKFHSFPI
jgi:CheY-like chemotaxis protein